MNFLSKQKIFFREDIRKLFVDVLLEMGSPSLELKIVEKGKTETFEWGVVTVPKSILKRPIEEIKNGLRHEVGHRIIHPATPDLESLTWLFAKKAVLARGILFDQKLVHDLGNIVSDTIVNYHLSRDFKFSDEYKGYMAKLLKKIRKGMKVQPPNHEKLFLCVSERIAGISEDCEFKYAVDEIMDILKSDSSLEDKTERLTEVYSRFLDPTRKSVINRFQGIRYAFQLSEDSDVMVRYPELVYSIFGLNPAYECDPKTGLQLFKDPLLLKAIDILLDKVIINAENELATTRERRKEFATWRIGDEFRELMIEETFKTYGLVIPGIFALTRKGGITPISKTPRRVAIIVDKSGSMMYCLIPSRAAALALYRECIKNDCEVYFYFFDTRSYHIESDIETYIKRVVPQGWTGIMRALRDAIENNVEFIYVITDAAIYDIKEALELLRKSDTKARFYVISAHVGEKVETLMKEENIEVFRLDPNKLTVTALKRIREDLG